MMASFEHSFATLGMLELQDRVERLAFNALPAALTGDMYRLQSISLFDLPSHFAVICWITRLLRRSRYAPYPFAARPQLDWLEADLQVGRPLIITEMDPSS